MNELSKYLCLLLRHQPEKAELDMDSHGWVSVEQLIDGVNRHSSYKLDSELLEQIVAEDNKGRYRYDEKHEKIKCCQGHSVPWVEPELEYCEPPEFLYHGTTTKALEAIEDSGAIKKMARHAVHMQADISKAWQSAERWRKPPVVLKIAAVEMNKDGYRFGTVDYDYINYAPEGTYPLLSRANGKFILNPELQYYGNCYSTWDEDKTLG